MRLFSSFRLTLLLAFSTLLTACSVAPSVSSGSASSLSISGRVNGGQQPVSGATIQLYTVGTTSDGGAATPLLTQTVTTAADGTFSISGLYSCTNASYVYLTATGGNPGLGSPNPNLALMTALGSCSSLTTTSFISVNELTTVAAVNALTPYMSSITSIGSSPANASDLAADFALANQFVSSALGVSPATSVPANITIPSALINTLGDIVAACINSAGGTAGDSTNCGQFFSLTIPGNAPAPTNTVAALLYLANNPTLNTAQLFNLIPASPPFQPSLPSAPADLRIRAIPQSTNTLQVSPSSLTFPATAVGTASTAQVVTIQNPSNGAVSISGITLTGANAADFAVTNSCGTSLAAGATCNALVTLTPSVAGARIAYLAVASNTAGSPQFVALAMNNAVPTLSSVNPNSLNYGATSPTSLLIIGSNFLPTSVVQVNGSNRPTTYFSATQLVFQVTVADQAAGTRLSVSVSNPPPGGGNSAALPLTIVGPSAAAVITQVSPTSFTAGSGNTSFAVYGSNFNTSSVVQWNGTNLATSLYLSSYTGYYLVANVPSTLLASTGTAAITVYNPNSSPTTSNSINVSIVNPPVPTLTSLSPATGPIGAATSVALYGTGFTAASTVTLNGTSIAATFVSSTSLKVSIPASTLTTPGNYSFAVTTPAPGGGTTASVPYTAYIAIANNSMIYNPVTQLFYVSVPGVVGAPLGNSIVSVDPATGALGTPIYVGSEPNKLAVTSDGRYLWVGLDGAGSVRKVDLVAGTAGIQFYLGGNSGVYDAPLTAVALAALPGQTDSVIVQTSTPSFTSSLNIYDAGVLRGTGTTLNLYPYGNYALSVDGTRNEVYAAGSGYTTYTYGASGLTLKATSTTSATYATASLDEIEIAGGRLYTSAGKTFDPESGALLGTFYSSGSIVAGGSAYADTALGKVFVLETSNGSQIQAFNISDLNPSSSSVIPVSITYGTSYSTIPNRLTRWGTNGLAFRSPVGVYSLRSNLVKDLSSTNADLGVTVAATGSGNTGSNSTYTATVTNSGPSNATGVSLAAFLPSTGVLVSATPSVGSCSSGTSLTCDLGSLANGASATIAFVVQQTTAGSATLQVQVSGSENDPVLTNNSASATVSVTGTAYSLAPTLTSIAPAVISAGSKDTVITVTGSGFSNGSSILLGSTTLPTSYVSATQLSATVPAANLTNLGWLSVAVSTPAPRGGTSAPLPLSIFSVLTGGLNHIVYDPYSRQIMASVGSGSSAITGNSIVSINPATASFGTPVPIGSQPNSLALTSDGQILYTILSGSGSIARFNMLSQTPDFTYQVPTNSSFVGGITLRGIATQPGTENTIALDIASFTGNAIYDFNPTTKTAAIRGQATGPYSGSCIQFLDAGDLLAFDTDTSGFTLDHYTVNSSGFTYYNYSQYTESTLKGFGCFKLSGGLAFANNGGVANPATTPATQLGVFPALSPTSSYSNLLNVVPDTSLQRVFFAGNATNSSYSSAPDSIETYNPKTFLLSGSTPFPFAAVEGNTSFTVSDIIRWGQDGLAILTNDQLYILRGPLVVPQLLNTNTAATLTSLGFNSTPHGGSNVNMTLTGSNFLPGVAVLWNGSYRTTTIVDATHISFAIPASDLASIGTASITVVNPGAPASSALTFTIN